MSATIGINDSKFVIFGSGHDYTLADSGEGEKIFFSHPYVPLNSINYAGQYYFVVPLYDDNDETVEPVIIDAVKDDIAHCTFTPDLGTVFDTEGEVTVKVQYRREYIYPESTTLVEKELEQTITVVNHGTVSNSYTYNDIYSDGYNFVHPDGQNVEAVKYATNGTCSKVSSIPWRATGLGDGIYAFLNCNDDCDITELAYIDTSNCVAITTLFGGGRNISDISPLADWDVSKVESLTYVFAYTQIENFEALSKWNTQSLNYMRWAFCQMSNLTSLDGLQNWDVSNVDNMEWTFGACTNLEDISALADWDVSSLVNPITMFEGCASITSLEALKDWRPVNVESMRSMFHGCQHITSLEYLADWNVKPTDLYQCFADCYALQSLEGLENFDTSRCTNMQSMFSSCWRVKNLTPLKDWDVSKVETFYEMFFGMPWIEDISGLKDWDITSATTLQGMFSGCAFLLDVSDIKDWDVSNVSNLTSMFRSERAYFCTLLNKEVWTDAYWAYDYEGERYSIVGIYDQQHPLVEHIKDASGVANWNVQFTANAFDNKWTNIPSWN